MQPIGRRGLLGEEVATRLARYIATQSLNSGDELPSEEELANRLGVGRRAVREGLRALSSQGVIMTHQGRRAVVSDWRPRVLLTYFDLSLIQDEHATPELYDLRFAIEVRAAERAAALRSEADLVAMDEAIAEMESDSSELSRYVDADVRFHTSVVRAARNRFYAAILQALDSTLREERLRGAERRVQQKRSTAQTVAAHRMIVEAIRAGDPAGAAAAMDTHLQDSLTYYWEGDQA